MATPNCLVGIPVYNEERHVGDVLRQVRQHVGDVLVVDDGSTDRTAALLAAEQDIVAISHEVNRGYGASLTSAFSFASECGYDWLITMDCDRQHEPSFIPRFRALAAGGAADIFSGSRYLRTFEGDGVAPSDRRQINARITRLVNQRLGLNITDAFCGFKAYRVESLRKLCITEQGYAMPMQLWVQAARADLRISEIAVPLIYNDPNRRFGGELDNPGTRFQHYLSVFEAELERGCCVGTAPDGQPVRAAG